MKLYLAESADHTVRRTMRSVGNTPVRWLLSYHYFHNVDLDRALGQAIPAAGRSVFLDSGAWSAFTQGVPIDLEKYAAFIRRFGHWFEAYSNLDDMTDPARTWDNQRRLEDLGLAPIPVFHTGEPFTWLERYIERYRYIALGKIIPHTANRRAIVPWICKAFKLAGGRAVFHGFGCTNWQLVCMFPWYSVDSSSWGASFRYGIVPLFDDRRGRFVKARLGKRREAYRHAALFRQYGYEPEDFADRRRNDASKISALAARSYMLAQDWLTRRHGPIELPTERAVA